MVVIVMHCDAMRCDVVDCSISRGKLFSDQVPKLQAGVGAKTDATIRAVSKRIQQ
jgi:hypothetical protein